MLCRQVQVQCRVVSACWGHCLHRTGVESAKQLCLLRRWISTAVSSHPSARAAHGDPLAPTGPVVVFLSISHGAVSPDPPRKPERRPVLLHSLPPEMPLVLSLLWSLPEDLATNVLHNVRQAEPTQPPAPWYLSLFLSPVSPGCSHKTT